MRRIVIVVVLALCAALAGFGYREAVRDPVVRRATVEIAGLPAGSAPLRIVLISDLHVQGPDMTTERLARIVAQVNALRPDAVLIAGDFISEKNVGTHDYSYPEAVAPLAGLRPRLGTVAVLGNHDYWVNAGGARAALAGAGVTVLANEAMQLGPLAVGGLDDPFTHHDDLGATLAQLRRLKGARLVLSHSPDPFAHLPGDVTLMLAGHTHCGQVSLPVLGAVKTMSAYGRRYACGRIDEGGKSLFVTAGLGTSGLPLRIGAPPDVWLIELRPAAAR